MQDRAVTKVAVPVVPGCSPLLETQHTPREIFVRQILHLLNNRSQINQSTVLSVYAKEFHSTVMLVLRVWERRKDGIFLCIIFYTVLVEIVVLTMFQCKPKSILQLWAVLKTENVFYKQKVRCQEHGFGEQVLTE